MKAVYKLVAGLAVAGLATAAIAARPMPRKVSDAADGAAAAASTAAAAVGFNYSTGFEAPEYPTGYIAHSPTGVFPAGCDSATQSPPCFGHTAAANASLITPTIDTNFPAGGTQHLRLTHDPATRTNQPNFGLGVDARYPHTAVAAAPVRPVAPNTVSIDLSIDQSFGQDFRVQPQSPSQTFLATSALFLYSGGIYILDDICGSTGLNFVGTGFFWDTSGAYQNYTVAMNPCTDSITYSYGGAPIYASCTYAGTNLEQFLIFGDNYPGSEARVDNLVMASDEGCPQVCGNGVLEGTETCEPGVVECREGHTCVDCFCDRICTLANPCVLENGVNTFYPPFDASFGGIFIYNSPAGVDAVSIETCGTTGADTFIRYWGSCSDPADPGSANDDCDSSAAYGSGSDPSASCYVDGNIPSPYNSCTCHDNPLDGDNCYLAQITGGTNSNTVVYQITVNKKAACGQGHLGSCCDTNGADTGCTDSVLSGDCSGADKVWTENGKCVDQVCECIPDCAGATCGDDGCGGSCGTCGDGNVCNGEETCNANRTCDAGTPLTCNDGNACNGVETCDPVAGCRPGQPLNCDNGVACDGQETCNPSSGCVSGTPVNCDDGIDCTVDSCNEPDGSCTNDDADCAIPTVSEWGLVVLTLMLLIGAKVYFGRRQAIA